MKRDSLGQFGIFERHTNLTAGYVRALEELGYSSVWMAASPPADLRVAEGMLDATESMIIATGIVNIWTADARKVAASWHRIEGVHPGRFLLGIGPGHPERHSPANRPYGALVEYLDILDAEGVPKDRRALAALGPRVLQLSADRALGAHPYLVTPRHTREAREIIGEKALLVPAQNVVLTTDRELALGIGREVIAPYLGLVNYRNNFLRDGFTEEDIADEGSDHFIEAMVPFGDAEEVARTISAHLEAGADHVPIQVQVPTGEDKLPGYEVLANALGLTR